MSDGTAASGIEPGAAPPAAGEQGDGSTISHSPEPLPPMAAAEPVPVEPVSAESPGVRIPAVEKGPGQPAREEAAEQPKTLEFHGLTLTLPAKMPFALLRHLDGNVDGTTIVGILRTLLGQDQLDAVFDLGLDIDEGTELFTIASGLYGTSAGKSSRSARS